MEIEKLKDNELLTNLDLLVTKEGTTTVEILKHLFEVDRRKLRLELGYSSLFSYCRERLKYSEGGANRRIKSARCIGKYSEVLEALTKREINLSTICIFESILTKENVLGILSSVVGKGQSEVERIVSTFKPEVKIKDRVKPVFVLNAPKEVVKTSAVISIVVPENKPEEKPKIDLNHRHFGGNHCGVDQGGGEERVKFTFSTSLKFHEKFKEIKALLSSKYPKGASFEEVFEEAMEEYLKNHSVKKTKNEVKASKSQNIRYVPKSLKEEVLRRDNYCCSFIGKEGRRCESKWDLEIDHIMPIGMGGETEISNLRVLCSQHNGFQARKYFPEKTGSRQSLASRGPLVAPRSRLAVGSP